MLEDQAADAELARHALQQAGLTFSLKQSETPEAFLAELRENPPDLIISDHAVPGLAGAEAFALVRREYPDLPFIFFTAGLEDRSAVESLKHGVTDYVPKHRLADLAPAVRRALRESEERTKRKAAEEALRKSEERYRQLVELSPCGILIHSQGRLLFTNPSGAALIGAATPDQLIGHAISEFVHPDDRQVVNERIKLLEQGHSVPFIEEKWLRLDGSVVEVAVAASPLLLRDNGEQTMIQVIALDITEQKRGQEALRHSEERFRLAVASVVDYAIYMVGADGRVTTWNTGAERMTGYGSPEAIGRTMQQCFTAEQIQRGEPQRQLERAATEGRLENEGWCVRKDGSRYFASCVITPIRDAAGRLTGYLKVARDMTAHKQHEDEVARWNAQLEHRVAERTVQLEAANKELEAFSYSVSHDLRAPLRHIDGFVDILQNHAAARLDEEDRHHLQTIADAAKQMGKLIDDLLAFSRMSRVSLNKRPVNLATLVQEILRPVQRDLKDRQVEWVIGDLPPVEGDLDLLRQVLLNLIDNALKYTRTRSVARIEIGSTRAAGELIFFIRDNGVGFDMRYVDKLFGVFQRLHRTSEFEGTGVGLANVRRIIHRHGGRTWAEGTVNGGATFYFSLPLSNPDDH